MNEILGANAADEWLFPTESPCLYRLCLVYRFLMKKSFHSHTFKRKMMVLPKISMFMCLLQKSFLHRFVNGKCEEFFRYIHDKMTDAEAEIRATITVQTTESTAAKKSEKEVPHSRTGNDVRRGTVVGGRRDTLVTGQYLRLACLCPVVFVL